MAAPRPAGADATPEERFARARGVQMADAVVFLVDWRLGMARGTMASGLPPLAEALGAVARLLRERIKGGDRDLFGVVAFGAGQGGTVVRDSNQVWEGVRVVLPLARADAEGIVRLQRLAGRLTAGEARGMAAGEADRRDRKDPCFSFGDGPVEMHNCLWAVRYQFMRRKLDVGATAATVFNRQRCYVLTNDDDPVAGFADGGAGVRARALSNAADLSEAGATVEVTFLREDGGRAFDASKFYSAVVFVDRDEFEEARNGRGIDEEGVGSVEGLEDEFRGRLVKKRTTARTVLRLDAGLVLGVALYSVVRKAARPLRVPVKKSSFEPLLRVSQTLCEWDGKVLGAADVRLNFDKLPFMASDLADAAARRAADEEDGAEGGGEDGGDDEEEKQEEDERGEEEEYRDDGDGDGGADEEGGANVPVAPVISGFTVDELRDLGRVAGPAGMTLYGFRDVSKLREEDIMKPPYFVYPDESTVRGSKKIFAALLHSMVRAKKMAIVLHSSDKGSSGPRFFALVPQAEVVDDRGYQQVGPGMHMIPLPYKNDVYTAWEGELATLATEEASWEARVAESDGALGVDDGGAGGSGGVDDGGSLTVHAVAKKIVKRLRLSKYDVSEYTDPVLDRYNAALEAAVGVVPRFEPPEDSLEPDVDLMRERAVVSVDGEKVDLFERFNALTVGRGFDADDIALLYGTKTGLKAKESAARQVKRKAEKDAKAEAARVDLDEGEYVAGAKNGTLETRSFTVPKLKQYCVAHGLATGGNKADIALRIYDHVNGPELDENVAL